MPEFILQNLHFFELIIGGIIGATIWWTSANFTNMNQNEDINKLKKRADEIEKKEEGYRKYVQMAEDLRERICKLEANDRQRDMDIAEIKSRLASIETNILWIKDMLIEKQRAIQNDKHITYK